MNASLTSPENVYRECIKACASNTYTYIFNNCNQLHAREFGEDQKPTEVVLRVVETQKYFYSRYPIPGHIGSIRIVCDEKIGTFRSPNRKYLTF